MHIFICLSGISVSHYISPLIWDVTFICTKFLCLVGSVSGLSIFWLVCLHGHLPTLYCLNHTCFIYNVLCSLGMLVTPPPTVYSSWWGGGDYPGYSLLVCLSNWPLKLTRPVLETSMMTFSWRLCYKLI